MQADAHNGDQSLDVGVHEAAEKPAVLLLRLAHIHRGTADPQKQNRQQQQSQVKAQKQQGQGPNRGARHKKYQRSQNKCQQRNSFQKQKNPSRVIIVTVLYSHFSKQTSIISIS